MTDPLENALPNKTHLKNNRSGNIATIIEVFPTLNEKTDWITIPGYHISFFGGRYQYITHNDLNKWSIVSQEEFETAFNKYFYGQDA